MPPTAPVQADAMIQVRLLESIFWVSTGVSLMRILNEHHYYGKGQIVADGQSPLSSRVWAG
jgi:hypothetical protein